MTDLSLSSSTIRMAKGGRTATLWGAVLFAALVGVAVGLHKAADPRTIESSLVLLLRFMAVSKAAVALAATALVAWRLRHSLDPASFVAYVAAVAPMACAPGFIWSLGLVAPGALLFHAGFLAFLVLAARDDAVGSNLFRIRRRAP